MPRKKAANPAPRKKKAAAPPKKPKEKKAPPPKKPKQPKEKKETWANSQSKAVLRAGILCGQIKPEMMPKEVFNMAPEIHSKWKYENWSKNLRSLQNSIERDRDRMEEDKEAFALDYAIIKRKRAETKSIPWHLSAAATLLKKDVDDERDKELKPMELYQSRPEYQQFELHVFRKHIYQERDCRPKREIRFKKKKKRLKYPELSNPDFTRLRNDELDVIEGEESDSDTDNSDIE